VQPGIIMLFIQSQQAPIILADEASPLVQVMTQPISVISTLHMPIAIQHWQTHMPFIIMQHPIMPLGFIMHSCCIMAAAVLSLQVQVHFIPPEIFSIFMVHRGTISPVIPGIIPGPICWEGMLMPMPTGAIIPIRSLVIVLLTPGSFLKRCVVQRP
jgi:hypothetical protein